MRSSVVAKVVEFCQHNRKEPMKKIPQVRTGQPVRYGRASPVIPANGAASWRRLPSHQLYCAQAIVVVSYFEVYPDANWGLADILVVYVSHGRLSKQKVVVSRRYGIALRLK